MTEVTDAYHFQGRKMIDREGEKVGKIDSVYANKQDGRRRWALVTTGLFGTRKTFVPLHDATPAGEDVRVPLEKAHVKDAPNIEADGGLSEREERELFAHYDVAYKSDVEASTSGGDDVSGPPTDDAMTRSEEEPRVGTERREAGRVRVGTEGRTEQETISETLRKERIDTDDDARA